MSIVIPAYNAEKYIEETIQSALSQTLDSFEVVIVNDGSTDRTEEIIQRYRDNERIKYYTYAYNRGAAHAYNYGVLHSSGEYLTFLDADDIYHPQYSEKVLDKMKTEHAHMGFADFYSIYGREKQSVRLYGSPREPRYNFIFGGEGMAFPTSHATLRKLIMQAIHVSPRAIYQRSLFLDYGLEDHRLKISHDWLRHIRFILNGAKCVFVDEPLGYYRFHEDGNSQKNQLQNMVEVVKVLEIVLGEMQSLLSEEEKQIATLNLRHWRKSLLTALATSDLRTIQIIGLLVENRF